jgi:hypothetical protein
MASRNHQETGKSVASYLMERTKENGKKDQWIKLASIIKQMHIKIGWPDQAQTKMLKMCKALCNDNILEEFNGKPRCFRLHESVRCLDSIPAYFPYPTVDPWGGSHFKETERNKPKKAPSWLPSEEDFKRLAKSGTIDDYILRDEADEIPKTPTGFVKETLPVPEQEKPPMKPLIPIHGVMLGTPAIDLTINKYKIEPSEPVDIFKEWGFTPIELPPDTSPREPQRPRKTRESTSAKSVISVPMDEMALNALLKKVLPDQVELQLLESFAEERENDKRELKEMVENMTEEASLMILAKIFKNLKFKEKVQEFVREVLANIPK